MALRVAAIQLRTSADRLSTLSRAANLAGQAAEAGARLVCLPEAFTGLYGVKHFASNAEVWKAKDSGTQLMSQLAAKHSIYVVGGVIEQDPISKKMHNTIAAFGPDGEEVARYRKMHLSRVSVGPDSTSEGSVLEAGDQLSWFDVMQEGETAEGSGGHGWRVGLLNCFDLRFKEMHSMLTEPTPSGVGAELVLYPSCWLKSTGDMGHWETLLKARALDGQCFVLGCNAARDDTQDTVAFGRSCAVGPMGQTLAMCKDDTQDEVVLTDLKLEDLTDARRRIPLQTSRRPLVYEAALRAQQQSPRTKRRPPPVWRKEDEEEGNHRKANS